MLNLIPAKTAFYALLLLALVGCSPSSYPNYTPLPVTAPTPRATYSLESNVIAKGVIVPENVAQLAFNIAGRVQRIDIEIGDQVHAGDILAQLDTVVLEADVAYFEGALQVAQAELENNKRLLSAAPVQAMSTARIKMAEANLVKARAILAQATLISPLDGTIIDMQAVSGETTSAGAVIATVADLGTLQVKTLDLGEQDISRVYEGQLVEIYIEAIDANVEGFVVKVAPQATLLEEKRVYETTIKFNSQPPDIRWGMSAEVNFVVPD